MKKNIFLDIEYDGSNYFGFQIQNKKGKKEITVQYQLQKALKKLFRQDVRVIYASRTDKGVHAKGQAVNFQVSTSIPLENIKKALNSFLPPDIKINYVKEVGKEFHSRFNAKFKIYRYIIFNQENMPVFFRNYCMYYPRALNLKKIMSAAKIITGEKDFSLFAKNASQYKNCVRYVKKISVKSKGKFIIIDIKANGFLRYMARNIIAFLIASSENNWPDYFLKEIITARERNQFPGPAAPAGLYLLKVLY